MVGVVMCLAVIILKCVLHFFVNARDSKIIFTVGLLICVASFLLVFGYCLLQKPPDISFHQCISKSILIKSILTMYPLLSLVLFSVFSFFFVILGLAQLCCGWRSLKFNLCVVLAVLLVLLVHYGYVPLPLRVFSSCSHERVV